MSFNNHHNILKLKKTFILKFNKMEDLLMKLPLQNLQKRINLINKIDK